MFKIIILLYCFHIIQADHVCKPITRQKKVFEDNNLKNILYNEAYKKFNEIDTAKLQFKFNNYYVAKDHLNNLRTSLICAAGDPLKATIANPRPWPLNFIIWTNNTVQFEICADQSEPINVSIFQTNRAFDMTKNAVTPANLLYLTSINNIQAKRIGCDCNSGIGYSFEIDNAYDNKIGTFVVVWNNINSRLDYVNCVDYNFTM